MVIRSTCATNTRPDDQYDGHEDYDDDYNNDETDDDNKDGVLTIMMTRGPGSAPPP